MRGINHTKFMEENIDVAVDTNTEVEEATNSNENEGVTNEANDEFVSDNQEATQEELAKIKLANLQILARAKRAESELKTLKAQNSIKINNNPPESSLSDELKLIARGLSDEEIDQAKIIARGKEVSLIEAIKDPLFIVYQDDLIKKQKRERAKLGASSGSEESRDTSLIKKGMTREEHQEVFKKIMA